MSGEPRNSQGLSETIEGGQINGQPSPHLSKEQWLVRTAQNVIAGPFTRDQIRQMILERKLGFQDEICAANHYWIYLHETEEIARQLSIEVPKPLKRAHEETTETKTVNEQDTDPGLAKERLERTPPLGAEESTMVMTARPAVVEPVPETPAALAVPPPLLGKVERPSVWRIFVIILIGLIVGLIGAVFFLLQT